MYPDTVLFVSRVTVAIERTVSYWLNSYPSSVRHDPGSMSSSADRVAVGSSS